MATSSRKQEKSAPDAQNSSSPSPDDSSQSLPPIVDLEAAGPDSLEPGGGDTNTVVASNPEGGTTDQAAPASSSEQVDTGDTAQGVQSPLANSTTEATASDGGSASDPNPAEVYVYPLRSYMDEGELRRRGGSAYPVPRRHAEDLVSRKLASREPLRE